MSTGQDIYNLGEQTSGTYDGIIKSCAIAIMPPAIVFGLSVQALATSIYMNQCNPGDMIKAGGAWIMLAEKNWEAADALDTQAATVTDDNWKGDDADAFKDTAHNVKLQLTQLAVTALLIGVQLIALGIALTIYWIFLTVCTGIVVAFLAAYVAAYAGVITAFSAEAVRGACLTVAGSLVATAKSFEATLTSISSGCAALTAGLTAFTFGFQKGAGNPVSPLDIAGAGLTNMLVGLSTFAVRHFTMTPGGKHAATGTGALLGHLNQSWGGGGFVLDMAEQLGYSQWDEHAPDALANPQEINWSG
jgi:hypothetical protein